MKQKVRSIALICDDFPSEGRPVYTFVKQLVDEMVRQGMEVHVIAPQSVTKNIIRRIPWRPYKSHVQLDEGVGYDIYRPYSISLGNHFRHLNLRKFPVMHVLRQLHVDAVYCHFWHNASPVYEYCLEQHLPIFVACGEGDNAIENLLSHSPEKSLSQLKRAVKGVISVSSENKDICIRYGLARPEQIVVLPNCVDQNLFHPARNTTLRHQLGVTENDFLIAFTGGFIERKGSTRLCQAINQLNDPSIKIMFIGSTVRGEGSNEPECMGMVFKGSLTHEKIAAYLQAADAFVLPTLKEGCSNAIVEALATGLPVISSNGAFNNDILDEHNSLRINPMSVDELREAICRLRNDTLLYRRLKSNAEREACNHSIVERAKSIILFMQK